MKSRGSIFVTFVRERKTNIQIFKQPSSVGPNVYLAFVRNVNVQKFPTNSLQPLKCRELFIVDFLLKCDETSRPGN